MWPSTVRILLLTKPASDVVVLVDGLVFINMDVLEKKKKKRREVELENII